MSIQSERRAVHPGEYKNTVRAAILFTLIVGVVSYADVNIGEIVQSADTYVTGIVEDFSRGG